MKCITHLCLHALQPTIYDYGQSVRLWHFLWPKRPWPKCPGRNVLGRNVRGRNVLHSLKAWVKVFRFIPGFRILRMTFHKSSSKCVIEEITCKLVKKKLSPHVTFSIAIMLKSQSLFIYLKILNAGENFNSIQVRQHYFRCKYKKLQLKIPIFWGMC